VTQAVFLIGFGGPSSSEEVRPFLDKVLAGRPVPQERYDEVVRQYEAVGGASPYNRLTFELAGKLELRLMKDGRSLPVYVGMRNATPPLSEALERMAADGITEAAGLILSSFRSEPSWERYVTAVEQARAEAPRAPAVRYLTPWNEDVLFIQALADRTKEGEKNLHPEDRADAHWLFTAHSIPVAADHPSRYAEQVNRAAARVAERLGHANWSLCFQSRSGRPEDPWLEPDVSDAISNLSTARSRHVLVIPIGFLLDHVEVLFDLDIKAARAAKAAGIAYHRAPTVGDHPAFLELLSLRAAHALGLSSAPEAR
jgi:ferrochelatase